MQGFRVKYFNIINSDTYMVMRYLNYSWYRQLITDSITIFSVSLPRKVYLTL